MTYIHDTYISNDFIENMLVSKYKQGRAASRRAPIQAPLPTPPFPTLFIKGSVTGL